MEAATAAAAKMEAPPWCEWWWMCPDGDEGERSRWWVMRPPGDECGIGLIACGLTEVRPPLRLGLLAEVRP